MESWNTMVMKQYPPEFKADAVALYRSRPDATIKQIAEDLGISRETLRSWVRREGQQGVKAPVASAVPVTGGAVEAENARLRRRVRELEEERDILRKAARYFAGETRW
jgi:transposase